MSSSAAPLLVSRGWRHPALGPQCHFLDYQYRCESRPYEHAAWRCDGEIYVEQSCLGLSGGFRQQALNATVAEQLLLLRPSQLLICGLEGASVDLARMAAFLGFESQFIFAEPPPEQLPEDSLQWLGACLGKASAIYVVEPLLAPWQRCLQGVVEAQRLQALPPLLSFGSAPEQTSFDYASYEFCLRDHPQLCKMQEIERHHFEGCQRVLDLGCGAGIFMQLLAEKNIAALGVERDPSLVAYGREMGLAIEQADALEFLRGSDEQFDGIYCSHFIEHLPFAAVQELIELLARRLAPGGRLLLAFPDPESIRSQLLGFWRDPEHVRYYHPELVQTLAAAVGLKLDWSSYQQQPHQVVGFSVQPPPLPQNLRSITTTEQEPLRAKDKDEPKRLMQKIAAKLGLATRQELSELKQKLAATEQDLAQQYRYNQALGDRTEALWQVNQTWAWNDNVTLRFTK